MPKTVENVKVRAIFGIFQKSLVEMPDKDRILPICSISIQIIFPVQIILFHHESNLRTSYTASFVTSLSLSSLWALLRSVIYSRHQFLSPTIIFCHRQSNNTDQ